MKLARWLAPAAGMAILSVTLPAQAASRHHPAGPSASADDQVFYALGVLLSRNLADFDLSEHEFREVVKGFTDGFRQPARLQDAQSLIPRLRSMESEREQVLISRQKSAGAAFLAKVAALSGARRTSSGLVFVSRVQGTGAAPKATDRVTVQYTGRLVDGTVFDSSRRRAQPASFPLVGIIPCWREALQLMRVGGSARVVCPSDLAYGDRGRPPVVLPGATLDFQIELLAVMPGPAAIPLQPRVR